MYNQKETPNKHTITQRDIVKNYFKESFEKHKKTNEMFYFYALFDNKDNILPKEAFIQPNVVFAQLKNWTLEQAFIENDALCTVLVYDDEEIEVDFPINTIVEFSSFERECKEEQESHEEPIFELNRSAFKFYRGKAI